MAGARGKLLTRPGSNGRRFGRFALAAAGLLAASQLRAGADLAGSWCGITTDLEGEPCWSAGDLESRACSDRIEGLWDIAHAFVAETLETNPGLDAGELVRRLHTLAGENPATGGPITAVRFAADPDPAFVVAWEYGWTGTFFIVGRVAGRFGLLWDIKELARVSYPSRDELGYWAFLGPGVHDGPLSGRVSPLPSRGVSSPRFLVDAITHPGMGEQCPGQISIWEWDGRVAVPELIRSYSTSLETQEVRVEGQQVRVKIVEPARTFFACGSCGEMSGEPAGTWTLRLDDSGVRDLGDRWSVPELELLDELVSRLRSDESTADLCTPRVRATLAGALRESLKDHFSLGMLDGYSIRSLPSGSGAPTVLDFQSDEIEHLSLTLENRGGKLFASAISFEDAAFSLGSSGP